MAEWYRKGSVPKKKEGRAQREERREKREERDQHDQDERVEEGNGSVPEWQYGAEIGRPLRDVREERRKKSAERSKKRATNTIKMRGSRWQWFGPRRAGWYRKGSVPKREEGREQNK